MIDKLNRLRELSATLNQLSERNTVLINLVQTILQEANIGVSDCYTVSDGEFWFGKINGAGASVFYFKERETDVCTRLLNCKRDRKNQFIEKLPHLLALLCNRLEERVFLIAASKPALILMELEKLVQLEGK